MATSDPNLLVSVDWLAERLAAPDIRILDASLYLPGDRRNGYREYTKAHIPGARFFDIDDIADRHSPLPHMLPPVEKFVSRVRKMGIGDGHRVIVYDQQGLFSAARVWWMFRIFGHQDVAVLDGGLPQWLAAGHPVDDDEPDPRERHFTGRRNASMVRDVTQIAGAAKLRDEQIVDARAPGLSTRLLPGFMGWVGEVVFDSVEVPASAVLGEAGSGWQPLRKAFWRAVPVLCAYKVGGAQAVFDMTL